MYFGGLFSSILALGTFFWKFKNYSYQNYIYDGGVIADLLAENLIVGLDFDDREYVHSILQSAKTDPDVLDAILYDADAQIFASTNGTTGSQPCAGS